MTSAKKAPIRKPQTLEEVMQYYNETIENLQSEIAMRDNEIATLKQRLAGFAVMSEVAGASNGAALLVAGVERDLYPGESREIILDILEQYQKQTTVGTRRHDILKDLLSHNHAKGIPKQKAKLLKDALKGFTAITSAIRQKLNDVGFDISERPNKHYRLKYYGDDRYKATMACSGGDKLRGGRNLAAELIQNML